MTRKSIFVAALAAVAVFAGGFESKACTNIIVTRGASVDNSSIVSYAADLWAASRRCPGPTRLSVT